MEPGPEGFVIGRIGIPTSKSGLEKIIEVSTRRDHGDFQLTVIVVEKSSSAESAVLRGLHTDSSG